MDVAPLKLVLLVFGNNHVQFRLVIGQPLRVLAPAAIHGAGGSRNNFLRKLYFIRIDDKTDLIYNRSRRCGVGSEKLLHGDRQQGIEQQGHQHQRQYGAAIAQHLAQLLPGEAPQSAQVECRRRGKIVHGLLE